MEKQLAKNEMRGGSNSLTILPEKKDESIVRLGADWCTFGSYSIEEIDDMIEGYSGNPSMLKIVNRLKRIITDLNDDEFVFTNFDEVVIFNQHCDEICVCGSPGVRYRLLGIDLECQLVLFNKSQSIHKVSIEQCGIII